MNINFLDPKIELPKHGQLVLVRTSESPLLLKNAIYLEYSECEPCFSVSSYPWNHSAGCGGHEVHHYYKNDELYFICNIKYHSNNTLKSDVLKIENHKILQWAPNEI